MAKLNTDKIRECADWVRENGLMEYGGARLKDFCAQLGIDDKTYYRWMKNADFSDSIKKAKEHFKNNLEYELVISLSRSAKGYEYEQITTEWMDVNGKPKIKKQVKKNIHVEPNIGANIFLLTNIAPERWKNRQDSKIEHSGNVETGFNIVVSNEDTVKKLKDILIND